MVATGFDVVAGRAKIFDEHGEDLTVRMLDGARAMLEFAERSRVELAIVTDMSAAWRQPGDFRRLPAGRAAALQKGVGVATALLLEAGIRVVSPARLSHARPPARAPRTPATSRPTTLATTTSTVDGREPTGTTSLELRPSSCYLPTM